MMRRPVLLCLALCFLLGPSAAAQVPPEKARATFTVADGLEISLWASEPLFVNPTCIDIDPKGRVWVCESVNYRDTLHHRPLTRPAGDRILILEDTKGVGKADKVTTFYQSRELLAPLGIAVAKDPAGPGYKVFVCQSPDILVFEDKDGDGKADGPPRKLLSGFRGIDHDHGVHGILIGPDGKLYFSVGDQGVEGLAGKNGKKKWTTNHTDCQAGTIWRCDLDGSNLELIAYNFRNEYEPCVDSFGTVFVSDNDDDGNEQTRICYVMPGGNYGYWPRGPGESHWHEEQPGVVPKILRTYFGSPTGMCVYEGTLLPKKYWGQLLHTDAGPRQVRCYHLTPAGAGYAVEREDMVTSTDTWFRPSDICVAPDGSVFVADWYDPGVGGHAMGDIRRGRIFRITPKGHKGYHIPKVNLDTAEGIVAALGSPALSVRYMAVQKIRSLDRKRFLEVTGRVLARRNPPWLPARARWACEQRNPAENNPAEYLSFIAPSILELDNLNAQAVRRLAARYPDLSQAPEVVHKQLRENAPRASTAVRREILLALRNTNPTFAREIILPLARKYDGKDRFYLEAIGIAVGHHDKARRDVILADFDKQFPEWNEKVANLIWELRPPQVLPRLERQLLDARLPAEQRARIVDVLAGARESSAGKTLLRALPQVPPAVRGRIIERLARSLPAKWRDLGSGPELAETMDRLLGQADSRADGLALIAATRRSDALPRVTALAHDPRQPPEVRRRAIETLGRIPSAESVAALGPLAAPGNGPLALDAIRALGMQIPMWTTGPGTAAALRRLQALALDSPGDPALREAAVTTLAESRPGTIWLLEADVRSRLPEALKREAGRMLRNSPYEDLRSQALAVFPLPARIDPKKLPGIAALASHRGDAGRGRQLIAASLKSDLQCLKCHTIHGAGGNVGPDLSVIGQKASRENLFESILFPSKAIADQYVSWVIETRNGLAVTGLLVEETADYVTLRDANARDTRIAKKDIESRTKSPTSLMPADLTASMTEDDLVDVVEYLFSLKAR